MIIKLTYLYCTGGGKEKFQILTEPWKEKLLQDFVDESQFMVKHSNTLDGIWGSHVIPRMSMLHLYQLDFCSLWIYHSITLIQFSSFVFLLDFLDKNIAAITLWWLFVRRIEQNIEPLKFPLAWKDNTYIATVYSATVKKNHKQDFQTYKFIASRRIKQLH